MRRHYLIAKSQMVSGSTECHRRLLGTAHRSRIGLEAWGDNTTPVLVQDPNETDYQPTRKRLNHRGPLSIDVSSAWYFITICANGHAPWVADEVKLGRSVAPRPPYPTASLETIAPLILREARENHNRGIWWLALFLVMPDHLHFIVNIGGRGATALPVESDADGCVTMLVNDVYAKSGSKWIDEEAHGLMAKCKGTYRFGFDAVEDGGHGVTALPAWTLRPVAKVEASFLKVVLKDTGVATITGTLPDKTKVNFSAKATASAADGSDKVEIKILSAAFSGKTITLPMEITVMNDGSFAEDRTDCGIIYSVER